MGEYVIALDQGTTSSRAVLIDRLGRIKGMSQSPFPQLFPQQVGWSILRKTFFPVSLRCWRNYWYQQVYRQAK